MNLWEGNKAFSNLPKQLLFYLDWLITGLIAVTLFLLPLIWYPRTAATFFTSKFCFLLIIAIILFCFLIVRLVLFRLKISSVYRFSILVGVPTILLLTVLFWLWNLLTAFTSVQLSTAVLGRYNSGDGLLFLTANLILFTAIFLFGPSQHQESILRKISIASCVFACLIGFLRLFGVYDVLLALGLGSVKSGWRISSTLGNPIYFGGYLILILPLLFPSILKSEKNFSFIAALLGAMLFLFFIILSFTRAAWLALFFSLLIFFVVLGRKGLAGDKQKLLIFGAALLCVLAAGSLTSSALQKSSLIKRAISVAQFSSPTTATRLEIWRGALNAIRSKTLLGWGPGCARYAFNKHSTLRKIQLESWRVDADAHNVFLTIAVNTGLPGLFLFLCVLVFLIYQGWAISKAEVSRDNLIPAALFAGIIGFCIHQLFNPPSVGVTPIMWVFVGWLLHYGYIFTWKERPEGSSNIRLTVAALLLIIILSPIPFILRIFEADSKYLTATISKSQEDAQEAVALNPFYEEYYALFNRINISQALSLKDISAFLKAVRFQKQIVKRNPMEVESYFDLGDMYMNGNLVFGSVKLDPANKAFRKALELRPNSAYGHARLGQCYLRQKQYTLARKHLSYSLKIFPDNAGVWLAMGNVEEALGNEAKAKRYYRKALLVDPSFYEAKKALENLESR